MLCLEVLRDLRSIETERSRQKFQEEWARPRALAVWSLRG